MKDEDILAQWELLSGRRTNEFMGNQGPSSKQVFDAHTFCASFMNRNYGKGVSTLDFNKPEDRALALDCYRFFDEQGIKHIPAERLAKFIGTYNYIERPSIYKDTINNFYDGLGEVGFCITENFAAQFIPRGAFLVSCAQSGVETVAEFIPDPAQEKVLTSHRAMIDNINKNPKLNLFQKLIQLECQKVQFMGAEGPADSAEVVALYEENIQKIILDKKVLENDLQGLRNGAKSEQEVIDDIAGVITKRTQSIVGEISQKFLEDKTISEKISTERNYKQQLEIAKKVVSSHIPYADIVASVQVCTDGASLMMHILGKHQLANKISVVGSGVVTICKSLEAIQTTSLLASAGSSIFTAFAAGGPYVALASAGYSIISALFGSGNDGMQKALQSISKQIIKLEKHVMKRINM